MKPYGPIMATLVVLAAPLAAQTPAQTPYPAPSEIVAAVPASDWIAIDPADLLVMTLATDARGRERRVVIQLMPAPFSQGWVGNIRTLAAAHWWDGLSINRVQDNYVVQWGDADGEDAAKARALPAGLRVVPEAEYVVRNPSMFERTNVETGEVEVIAISGSSRDYSSIAVASSSSRHVPYGWKQTDGYATWVDFRYGWPLASGGFPNPEQDRWWPVHCYGMVGVGRNLSPDTGSGAELYTVIGHAPRHLDRNIALVGRVIEGIEHLSSLPRGTGALGFYESAEERVPILSVRLATELPTAEQPRFEYLSTESESFARYADARANRRDPFFNVPAGGADICNIPVPVRRAGR